MGIKKSLALSLFWLIVPIGTPLTLSQTPNPQETNTETRYIFGAPATTEAICLPPVLSRLTRHRVAAGETLESVASRYNLVPATLVSVNPGLRGGKLPVGKEILIPPFNGTRVETPSGASWQDVAAAYGVGADVLFEINGCQRQPKLVFIPSAKPSSGGGQMVDTYTGFPGYPLPTEVAVGLGYGWNGNPETEQASFHGGIDLLADPGTSVLSVAVGTVAFADQQGDYGNLVVINHAGGRQTRYAHLNRVSVTLGQQVQQGTVLGTVGSTGNPSIDQPHLHFEVRYNSPQGWVAQDPVLHIKARPTAQR
ncbi:MAG: M23 family metallopeptidase [Kastovskya adunca ATA6-11-RM4]|jgi:murein DD-endopeptidase MepM/ murein hydrolase activator NlpD|nr:M23 family metallopeptidase [Kastovskya adunca ATA6-11-RM4]